jgi:hypothetical protein
MRLLPECRVAGEYHWQQTTAATDSLEINDADELFAKLPLGAASLEASWRGDWLWPVLVPSRPTPG